MIRISLIILAVLSACGALAQQADLIIKNGRIIDGTGNSWYYGGIAIRDGKIIGVGNISSYSASKIIDAQNRVIAPGFIDVHTHIEEDEVRNPTADNFIYDGVTTVITGNCGDSRTDIGGYLDMIDSLKLSVNAASLIGHNDIRIAVMGKENRAATEEELNQMEALVEKAMKAGAKGLSTGLIYIPGTFAPTSEIIRLAKIAQRYHGVYATHMRSEGDSVKQAISEAINIGREANIPVQISHFKVGGQSSAGRSFQTLQMIEDARREGIEVTIDQYPYTASSTTLSTLLPDWVLAGTDEVVRKRLTDKDTVKFITHEMIERLHKRGLRHYSYAVVANFKNDSNYNGRSIEEINRIRGRKHKAREEVKTIIELYMAGGAGMVFHGMYEEDVQHIMKYPFNMIASDASIRVFGQGVPHPRGYGSNGKVLAKYVRELNLISLEEAIRRMTSLPAQKFNLQKRGLLIEGYAADIVVFDPEAVQDQSTYTNPHAYTKGFNTVIVNGTIVVSDGKHTGARAGMTLR
jgi:N-acyl-D-amino-acid deacylase